MNLKARLLMLLVLCLVLAFVLSKPTSLKAATVCGCTHWIVVGTDCDKECVAARYWCRSHPTDWWSGYFVDSSCSWLISHSVAACDQSFDCYQCASWNCN